MEKLIMLLTVLLVIMMMAGLFFDAASDKSIRHNLF